MTPSSRDRISVDLRGLRAALLDQARARGVTPSDLVRGAWLKRPATLIPISACSVLRRIGRRRTGASACHFASPLTNPVQSHWLPKPQCSQPATSSRARWPACQCGRPARIAQTTSRPSSRPAQKSRPSAKTSIT